jgi:hypothetical protein
MCIFGAFNGARSNSVRHWLPQVRLKLSGQRDGGYRVLILAQSPQEGGFGAVALDFALAVSHCRARIFCLRPGIQN